MMIEIVLREGEMTDFHALGGTSKGLTLVGEALVIGLTLCHDCIVPVSGGLGSIKGFVGFRADVVDCPSRKVLIWL